MKHSLGWGILLWASLAWASGFSQIEVETRHNEVGYWLDAQLHYRFSDTALDALENGVPLTVGIEIQVRRHDAWLWEIPVTRLVIKRAIRYQTLSELYQVTDFATSAKSHFATRDAAMAALGSLQGMQLLAQPDGDPQEAYEVRLRTQLDINALPLPLRPLAYLKSAWNLDSGWYRWPLIP